MSLVRNQQVTVFRAPASLPDNSILAILEDREQNIWVGTADGLVRMSAPDVGALNKRDGLSEDNVATTYCDQRGSLWFTTVTGRVFQYVNGRVEPVHLPPPADLLRIRGTFEDHTGAFWFGTDNQGVVRFANGKATRFTVAEGLAQQRHSSVLRRSKSEPVDRHNQRTQPLGRLALQELLSRRGALVRVGSRHRRRPQWRHAGGHGPRPQSLPRRQIRGRSGLRRAPPRSHLVHLSGVAGHPVGRHSRRRPGARAKRKGIPNHDPGRAVEQLHFSRGWRWTRQPLDERSAGTFRGIDCRPAFRRRRQVGIDRGSRLRNRRRFGVRADQWRRTAIRVCGAGWRVVVSERQGSGPLQAWSSADHLSCAGSRGVGSGGWQGCCGYRRRDDWPGPAAGRNRIHRL